ncbi:Hypothetical predicted protein [Cloeon dipterum]|uniref:BACK domain-containing protein n=1 Tax=Cloeon dipterum TaxID=197152 RepID=A0A8S1DG56_9INSE|nr:Hypothetical predicted protein [Cloeon dipterum]
MEPKIARAITDFHEILNRFEHIDDLIKLAKAVESSKIKHLEALVLTMLNRKFDQDIGNVWKILSHGYNVKSIADACAKRLSKETKSMLACKEFLQIQPEALARFLAIEEMDIDSEFTLVQACITYAWTNEEGEKHAIYLFQKYALPHLRMLTLTSQQLLEVPILTTEDLPEITKSLSLSKKKRSPNCEIYTMTFVPEEDVLPLMAVLKTGSFCLLPWEESKFVLAFDAKTKFEVKRVEVFCPLDLGEESNFFDEHLMENLRIRELDCYSERTSRMTVRVKIRHQGKLEVITLRNPTEDDIYWATFNVNIVVPATARVKVKVSYNGRVTLRYIESNVERMIKENDRCVRELFDNVELDQFYEDDENGFRWVRKDAITVFKNIHVCPCDKPDISGDRVFVVSQLQVVKVLYCRISELNLSTDFCYSRVKTIAIQRKMRRNKMRDLTDENIVTLRFGYGGTKTYNYKFNRALLMAKSEYFREAIPRSTNGEINVYFIDALTFKKVLELLENPNSNLNNENNISNVLIPLTEAAIKLRCREIGEKCVKRLLEIVNMDNVWKIYNGCYLYEPIARKCEELLSRRALDLLAQPEFLEIKPETLAQFLQLEKMEINSELDLFKACDRFARSRKHVNQRAIFRIYALPHLRMLTLTDNEIFFNASFYLEPEESLFFNYHLRYSSFRLSGVEAKGFCLNNSQRKRDGSCDILIVPDKEVLDLVQIFKQKNYCEIPDGVVHKFVLSFEAKKKIRIQKIGFFSPLSLSMEELFEPNILKTLQEREKEIQSSFPKHKAGLKVTVEGQAQSLMDVSPRYIFLNKWTTINLNAVVPENARVTLEVEFHEIVGNLSLEHSVTKKDGSVDVVDNATTVFKSVHACTVDRRPELILEMDEAQSSLIPKFEGMGIKRKIEVTAKEKNFLSSDSPNKMVHCPFCFAILRGRGIAVSDLSPLTLDGLSTYREIKNDYLYIVELDESYSVCQDCFVKQRFQLINQVENAAAAHQNSETPKRVISFQFFSEKPETSKKARRRRVLINCRNCKLEFDVTNQMHSNGSSTTDANNYLCPCCEGNRGWMMASFRQRERTSQRPHQH